MALGGWLRFFRLLFHFVSRVLTGMTSVMMGRRKAGDDGTGQGR